MLLLSKELRRLIKLYAKLIEELPEPHTEYMAEMILMDIMDRELLIKQLKFTAAEVNQFRSIWKKLSGRRMQQLSVINCFYIGVKAL